MNLAAVTLELGRGSPVLGSCPPLDLVPPHLDNICSYFSRYFTSYLAYRGESCYLTISGWGLEI